MSLQGGSVADPVNSIEALLVAIESGYAHRSCEDSAPWLRGDPIFNSSAPAITLFLVAALAGTNSNTIAHGEDLQFQVKTKRESDKVKIAVAKETASISVRSPFGISRATIERTQPNWPKNVTLRLHLKGLERLRISNQRVTLEASVSHHNRRQIARLWIDSNEHSPLTTESPFWMKIRSLDEDGNETNAIRLGKGSFEMRLPKALFEGNPKSITIDWIDFYR